MQTMTRIVRYRPWNLSDQNRGSEPTWSPLSRLHQQMNRLFEDTFQRDDGEERGFNPSIDVDQEEDRYEITVELPGVARDDVTVEVRDDYLLISGSKRESQKSDQNERVHSYRRYGSFHQALSLPEDANRDTISADFSDGVLSVRIARDAALQRDRVRRIEVGEGRDSAETQGSESRVDAGRDAPDRRKADRAKSHQTSDEGKAPGKGSAGQASTG
jgi:HSP20 family protein